MIERLTLGLIFAVLMLAPLPLGSTRPLAQVCISIAAALSLISWGWHSKLNIEWIKLKWIGLCFGAVCVWYLLQMPLSMDSSASLLALLRLSTYMALFAVTFQVARDYKTARQLVKLLAFSGAFYAAYGLAVYALGNDHLLWLEKWAYTDSLTATFVNRNAFAAYAGIILLSCLSLIAQAVSRENGDLHATYKTASATLWLAVFGVAVIVPAIFLTNSRAGICSIVIGLIALWFGLYFSQSLPRRALIILGLIGTLLAAGALSFTGERLFQRSTQAEFMADDRPQIWLATLRMINDKPLTGFGPGTYSDMFLQYRTPAIKQNYTQAHSTYLEMAAEVGVPATVVFFTGFGLIGLFLLRGIHIRRQHKMYPVLAFAVLTQAAAHSLVDFSFQTPANAAILAIILGVGMAQSFSAEQR